MKKVLHIGQMKSGTTYVQNVMAENRGELAKKGWLYPGKLMNQQHACYGICGSDIYWIKENNFQKHSDSLQKEISKFDGNVVLSSEALSSLSREGVSRFLEEIGEVDEVIVTVRSLFKTLPSAWQQYIKGGGVESIERFFEKLVESREELSGFWRTYSFGNTVRIWSEFSDVKVVIIPDVPASKNQLWDDFSEAAGLPPIGNSDISESQANLSLNYEAAEIFRHINICLKDDKFDVPKAVVERFRRNYLNKYIFPFADKKRGKKVTLPLGYEEHLLEWSREEVESLRSYSSEIRGDCEGLMKYEGSYLSADDFYCENILNEIAFQVVNSYKWP